MLKDVSRVVLSISSLCGKFVTWLARLSGWTVR